jgi:hypothetical protein
MDQEHREAIKKANRRRGTHICQKCKQSGVQVRDGSEIGAMPGIKYRCCNSCGWQWAITHRRRT